MVRISIDNSTKEIVIRMPVFYLYEVIDNDEWLTAVLQQAKELVIDELNKAGLNEGESDSS